MRDEYGEYVWRTIRKARIKIYKNKTLEESIKIQKNKKQDDDLTKLNFIFKKIKSYEELKSFEEELEKSGNGVIRTKRAKWHAYSFSKVGENKVRYLLSDGKTIRTHTIGDLPKYLEIADRAR